MADDDATGSKEPQGATTLRGPSADDPGENPTQQSQLQGEHDAGHSVHNETNTNVPSFSTSDLNVQESSTENAGLAQGPSERPREGREGEMLPSLQQRVAGDDGGHISTEESAKINKNRAGEEKAVEVDTTETTQARAVADPDAERAPPAEDSSLFDIPFPGMRRGPNSDQMLLLSALVANLLSNYGPKVMLAESTPTRQILDQLQHMGSESDMSPADLEIDELLMKTPEKLISVCREYSGNYMATEEKPFGASLRRICFETLTIEEAKGSIWKQGWYAISGRTAEFARSMFDKTKKASFDINVVPRYLKDLPGNALRAVAGTHEWIANNPGKSMILFTAVITIAGLTIAKSKRNDLDDAGSGRHQDGSDTKDGSTEGQGPMMGDDRSTDTSHKRKASETLTGERFPKMQKLGGEKTPPGQQQENMDLDNEQREQIAVVAPAEVLDINKNTVDESQGTTDETKDKEDSEATLVEFQCPQMHENVGLRSPKRKRRSPGQASSANQSSKEAEEPVSPTPNPKKTDQSFEMRE
ncbi:uncharacterized protein KY384_007994 [Bacidia gigantensis]|uniref:uncharacterized protein n=1 Tax=Bacidia gigantensis TaxID=2732470 RepID=UPI001D0400D8|nr:uncharacterized protein KY384_007994 [Bacidia gigantensis]KAG8527250.1 hypothetical protein KY384_007994 [Bacidia gigantensis]